LRKSPLYTYFITSLPKIFINLYIGYETYEQLYQALREDEVRYGLVNSDIAAYAQQWWNNNQQREDILSVVTTLPIEIPIHLVQVGLDHTSKFATCIDVNVDKAIKFTERKHRKKLKVRSTVVLGANLEG